MFSLIGFQRIMFSLGILLSGFKGPSYSCSCLHQCHAGSDKILRPATKLSRRGTPCAAAARLVWTCTGLRAMCVCVRERERERARERERVCCMFP